MSQGRPGVRARIEYRVASVASQTLGRFQTCPYVLMTAFNNILVMQSGGVTPVINRSLYGVVREALDRGSFGGVYGAVHGVEGLRASVRAGFRACLKTQIGSK